MGPELLKVKVTGTTVPDLAGAPAVKVVDPVTLKVPSFRVAFATELLTCAVVAASVASAVASSMMEAVMSVGSTRV
jgi:hypothetical protein